MVWAVGAPKEVIVHNNRYNLRSFSVVADASVDLDEVVDRGEMKVWIEDEGESEDDEEVSELKRRLNECVEKKRKMKEEEATKKAELVRLEEEKKKTEEQQQLRVEEEEEQQVREEEERQGEIQVSARDELEEERLRQSGQDLRLTDEELLLALAEEYSEVAKEVVEEVTKEESTKVAADVLLQTQVAFAMRKFAGKFSNEFSCN